MDARILAIQECLQYRPPGRVERLEHHREAAVALLLRAHEQLELLLIKRAEHERDPWSGHIALPGGRRSPQDEDLIGTAWRETEEEIGITLTRVGQYIGALDEVAPLTPRLPPLVIAPFVVAVPSHSEAIANPAEVDFAVWVPLPVLREPGAIGQILIQFEGRDHSLPSRRFGDHVVWGLTLRIIEQFFEVLETAGV